MAPEGIDRFEIVQPLAVGGMSHVFLAHDRRAGRDAPPVVLKRLFPHFAAQPVLVARFRHEADLLARLAHPGVPRLVAHGAAGDTFYLAQTRVAGTGLDARLESDARGAPIAEAIAIARALLAVLDHVHARVDPATGAPLAIVHRDVTPANVFVAQGAGGVVTDAALIDFGIATSALLAEDERANGGVRGTPGYTAPEAITRAHPVDARADVFAVGVILHELLTGRRLYGGGALAAMYAITDGPVPAPRDARPECPPALDAIVRAALAKQPGERFASAGAMADALGTVSSFQVT